MRRCFRKAQRQKLLSVVIVDTWANFYRLRDELRYDPSFQSLVGEVEVGGASVRFGKTCILKLEYRKGVCSFSLISVQSSPSVD